MLYRHVFVMSLALALALAVLFSGRKMHFLSSVVSLSEYYRFRPCDPKISNKNMSF